jgi:hypothetical protein
MRVHSSPLVSLVLATFALGTLPALAQELPFERTEERAPCADYDPLKQPFFGETHLHTSYSFDASTTDARTTPAQAYAYAKGARAGVPAWADTRVYDPTSSFVGKPSPLVRETPYCFPGEQCAFTATRSSQLPAGRALDFAALTDHAETFGENNICLFEPTQACQPNAGECPDSQACLPAVSATFPGPLGCVPKGYDRPVCVTARDAVSRLRANLLPATIVLNAWTTENPTHDPLCDTVPGNGDAQLCIDNAQHVWERIQADAEEAYDRSSNCSFTSFVAYEYTATPNYGRCSVSTGLPCWQSLDCPQGEMCQMQSCPSGLPESQCETVNYPGSGNLGSNLHRNVIFRNDDVIERPLGNVAAPINCGGNPNCDRLGPIASPDRMLIDLKKSCIENPLNPRCDVISIPHNANMSGGAMFLDPKDRVEASIRGEMEPLTEIHQIKGASECRWQQDRPGAWGATDDECAFEIMNYSRLATQWIPPEYRTPENIPPRSFVRNALKAGLQYASQTGINPFKLGFVGALDNHSGNPGQSEEIDYAVSLAHGTQSAIVSGQALNEKFFLGLETNGGGMTAVWAEENSRDAIFNGMKNRETYATSGTRPTLRFFGGFDLDPDICKGSGFAEEGYQTGVPMGGCLSGELDPEGKCRSGDGGPPSFAIQAFKDPGWEGHPGTDLERAQIIKGWVDNEGNAHETVIDVAGKDKKNHANLDTCAPAQGGKASLCAVWTDPNFNPDQHAFYYARVLENESCRWNQYYCNAKAVNCSEPMGTCRTRDGYNGSGCDSSADCGGGDAICEPPVSYTEYEYSQCCNDELVPKTIQQRAWSSPIWYTPHGGG